MKKTTSVLFILLMLLTLISSGAYADETVYTEGALSFTVVDQSITIVGYFGREEEVTIPSMIAGTPVNVIGTGAFVGTNAKTVYLPDCIMEVQEGAFDAGVSVVYNCNTDHPSAFSGGTPAQEPDDLPAPDANSETADPIIPTDVEKNNDVRSVGGTTSPDVFDVEEVEVLLDESLDDIVDEKPDPTPEPTPEPTETPEETEAPAETAAPEAPAEQKSSSTVILIVAAVAVVAVVAVLLTKKKK